MNPMTELTLKLKDHGYNQSLVISDNIYLQNTGEYVRYNGGEIPGDYVKVPSLANLVSNVMDLNFSLEHEYLGEDKERWTLRVKNEPLLFQEETLYTVLANLWLYKKGMK